MPRLNHPNISGILTVNEVSRLLTYSAPTVRKWVDSGKIKGAFRIPSTKERRIPAPGLITFLKVSGMPIPDSLYELEKKYNKTYKHCFTVISNNNNTHINRIHK